MGLELEEVTLEEGRQIVDQAARRYLGISGEEFRRCWERGEYGDDGHSEVIHVAMLLPFGSQGNQR